MTLELLLVICPTHRILKNEMSPLPVLHAGQARTVALHEELWCELANCCSGGAGVGQGAGTRSLGSVLD